MLASNEACQCRRSCTRRSLTLAGQVSLSTPAQAPVVEAGERGERLLGLDGAQQRDRLGRQRQPVRALLLGARRRLGPDASGQVNVRPTHIFDFTSSGAGQEQEQVELAGQVLPLMKHSHEPLQFAIDRKPLAAVLPVHRDAGGRVVIDRPIVPLATPGVHGPNRRDEPVAQDRRGHACSGVQLPDVPWPHVGGLQPTDRRQDRGRPAGERSRRRSRTSSAGAGRPATPRPGHQGRRRAPLALGLADLPPRLGRVAAGHDLRDQPLGLVARLFRAQFPDLGDLQADAAPGAGPAL